MYVVIYDYLPMEDENFNDFESWYGDFHNIMFTSVECFLLCFFRKPLQEKYITYVSAVFYFFLQWLLLLLPSWIVRESILLFNCTRVKII